MPVLLYQVRHDIPPWSSGRNHSAASSSKRKVCFVATLLSLLSFFFRLSASFLASALLSSCMTISSHSLNCTSYRPFGISSVLPRPPFPSRYYCSPLARTAPSWTPADAYPPSADAVERPPLSIRACERSDLDPYHESTQQSSASSGGSRAQIPPPRQPTSRARVPACH